MTGDVITLGEAITEFLLASAADGLRPKTIIWYTSILKTFADQINDVESDNKRRVKRKGFRGAAPVRFNTGDVEGVVARCPDCGRDDRQIKIGKNESGSQRFKCKPCGVKYTPRG